MKNHPPKMLQGFPLYERDEDLLANVEASCQGEVSVRICDESAVVLGRSSRPEMELHLDYCRSENIPIFRRRGGGCSVWLDPGNIIVSLAFPIREPGNVHERFARISRWMCQGLHILEIPCEIAGISDLVLGNRKIGGSALYLRRNLLYYSTTLLHHPDVEAMERILRHPPREPDYRRGRSHRDFVGQLDGLANFADIRSLVAELQKVLRLSDLQMDYR